MPARSRTAAARANNWGGRRAQGIRAEFKARMAAGEVFRCPFCGGLVPPWSFDIDHQVPLDFDAGGIWDRSLMRPACSSCNRAAGARLVNRKRSRAPRPRRLVPCAGCESVLVSPVDWLCRDCALVVAGN